MCRAGAGRIRQNVGRKRESSVIDSAKEEKMLKRDHAD